MKPVYIAINLFALSLALVAGAARSQPADHETNVQPTSGQSNVAETSAKTVASNARSLRIVHENALLVKENARIRQWTRVNREVDRIIENKKGALESLGSGAQSETFRSELTILRKARLNRDADAAIASASRIVELTASK